MSTVQQSIAPDPKRRGLITASRMADVMAFSKPKREWCVVDFEADSIVLEECGGGKTGETKAKRQLAKLGGNRGVELRVTEPGGPLQARRDYTVELVIERLGGSVPGFGSAATAWGQDCEPHARAAWEARSGILAKSPGFLRCPDVPYVGATPDFLTDDAGGEIKSPYNPMNHMAAILSGMPEEHVAQVQGGMWVTGRRRWHFISYDPRMPEELRLYTQVIERDDVYIAKLAEACASMHADADKLVEQLRLKAAA